MARGDQTVFEAVLRTVLLEVENMLNIKPLRYASLNFRDIGSITYHS